MTQRLTKLARRLRKEQTDAEGIFWQAVRNRRFHNLKFRRQVPVGKYVVDFLCEAEKLVIELDGEGHALRVKEDSIRTQEINELGYKVLRFWNADIYSQLDDVLFQILTELGIAMDSPSPKGEGARRAGEGIK